MTRAGATDATRQDSVMGVASAVLLPWCLLARARTHRGLKALHTHDPLPHNWEHANHDL
jgi:hypothetical protein